MSTDDFELEEGAGEEPNETETGRFAKLTAGDDTKKYRLTGMYKDWFLDYASYVILERAVPHLNDGLKPVQRRILHAMKRLDDGRFNKVANIIGFTMQFHPHGDASIGDALVQLGQKDLLVETQGNWGNILTGDSAAASRYIEARLSKFANDVVFNPKTTEWMPSYDGRNQEPVTLPIKFPLLLAQGVEGIAVGLASKILPHNFNELIDASIAHLKNKDFGIFPDFPTGGLADCSRYNDGLRGGVVKVRAKINKLDRKTLVVTEIPYGKTTSTVIESILKANDKGKIKIRKVDDNTALNVEIVIHLPNDVSPDKTIDALYAFTDCEISISPNACIISNDHPHFIGVKQMLRMATDRTRDLLQQELEIRLNELNEQWHFSLLEKIFIEKRIYLKIEECETWDEVIEAIDKGLKPYKKSFRRSVTVEDITKLTEIKIKRISKYDSKKADDLIKNIEDGIEEVQNNLNNLVSYTITYYQQLKKKYGKNYQRLTELAEFSNIEAAQVVVASQKLYVNRAEGFVGTSLKKDEYVCDCSDIDDIIVFLKGGKYVVTKVSDKAFIGKDIIHIGVFRKGDTRTIYNVVYRDGKNGPIMIKRFAVTGVTRDKEYDVTRSAEGSQVLYMSANPNGEAEILKVYFKPRPRIKNLIVELNFADLTIKGRGSMGNIFTRYAIHKVVLKEKGESTLGGQSIWFDDAVRRLNTDGHGRLLGEFGNGDRVLAVTKQGKFYTTDYDLSNRYEEEMLLVEKFDPEKIFSATYYDAEQKYFYVKRLTFEESPNIQLFIDETEGSYLVELSSDDYPQLEVTFKGKNAKREPEQIDVDEFIGVKSFRAKGKRVSILDVSTLKFIEPLEKEPLQSDDDDLPSLGDDANAVQMSLL